MSTKKSADSREMHIGGFTWRTFWRPRWLDDDAELPRMRSQIADVSSGAAPASWSRTNPIPMHRPLPWTVLMRGCWRPAGDACLRWSPIVSVLLKAPFFQGIQNGEAHNRRHPGRFPADEKKRSPSAVGAEATAHR